MPTTCQTYSCNDTLSLQATNCTSLGATQRICTCPNNYIVNGGITKSITLTGAAPFSGCVPLVTSTLADVCPICCYIDNSGESFTATASEDLISVDFYLQGVTYWATGIYVEIRSVSFTGQVMGQTPSVPFAAGQPAKWVTFTFNTPVKLTKGSVYYLKGVPGTGYTYTPNPGMCNNVYTGGVSYLQGSPYSPQDYSLRITMTNHCGNKIVDTAYGEVCDGASCKADCSGYIINSAVGDDVVSSSSGGGLSLPVIIGLSVGAAVGFILVVIVIVVVVKQTTSKKEQTEQEVPYVIE